MKVRYNLERVAKFAAHRIGLELLTPEGEVINLSRGGDNFESWVSRELNGEDGWLWILYQSYEGFLGWEFGLVENSLEWQELPEDLWAHILSQCGGDLDEVRQKDGNALRSELEQAELEARQQEEINRLAERRDSARRKVEEALGKGFDVGLTDIDGVYCVTGALRIGGQKKKFGFTGTLEELSKAWNVFQAQHQPLKSGKPKPVKKNR